MLELNTFINDIIDVVEDERPMNQVVAKTMEIYDKMTKYGK